MRKSFLWRFLGGARLKIRYLSIMEDVSVRFLYCITVRSVWRRTGRQVWGNVQMSTTFPCLCTDSGLKMWNSECSNVTSFKPVSVKSVPRATWNGCSVGNGMDKCLGWYAWANEESRISLESNYGLSKKAVVGAKSLSSGSAWCFFFHLNILLHQWKYPLYKTIPMRSANLTFHRDNACCLKVVFSVFSSGRMPCVQLQW